MRRWVGLGAAAMLFASLLLGAGCEGEAGRGATKRPRPAGPKAVEMPTETFTAAIPEEPLLPEVRVSEPEEPLVTREVVGEGAETQIEEAPAVLEPAAEAVEVLPAEEASAETPAAEHEAAAEEAPAEKAKDTIDEPVAEEAPATEEGGEKDREEN